MVQMDDDEIERLYQRQLEQDVGVPRAYAIGLTAIGVLIALLVSVAAMLVGL